MICHVTNRGTEMQHVADDYAARLHAGSVQCQQLLQDVLGSVMVGASDASSLPALLYCEYLNVSLCPLVDEAKEVCVYVYIFVHACII